MKKNDTHLGIRAPKELIRAIRRIAREERETPSTIARTLLVKAIEARDKSDQPTGV